MVYDSFILQKRYSVSLCYVLYGLLYMLFNITLQEPLAFLGSKPYVIIRAAIHSLCPTFGLYRILKGAAWFRLT